MPFLKKCKQTADMGHVPWLDVANLPNSKTQQCFELLKNHQEAKKLVIVTHGFLNNFGSSWLHTMKDAIQQVDEGTAVIVRTLFQKY